ncbi:MAG: hypothetical protein Q8R91_10520 [Candidatus Omnitrophota bacterium]|nr:hypothetical protein [Candidatus Omnitrophota bacterium]
MIACTWQAGRRELDEKAALVATPSREETAPQIPRSLLAFVGTRAG